MPFGAMVQGHVHAEFLRDPQDGQDIVSAMGMGFKRNLLPDDGEHCLELKIIGALPVVFLFRSFDFPGVIRGFPKGLPEQGGDGHPCHRLLSPVLPVTALGVFSEGDLHRHRVLQDHAVRLVSDELDREERSSDYIGGPGAGHGCGNAAAPRFLKGRVHGVQTVDSAHLRGYRRACFVVIGAFPADSGFVQADVGVGVDQPGSDIASARVEDFASLRHGKAAADGGDSAVVDKNGSAWDVAVGNCFDKSVSDHEHGLFLPSVYSCMERLLRCSAEFSPSDGLKKP